MDSEAAEREAALRALEGRGGPISGFEDFEGALRVCGQVGEGERQGRAYARARELSRAPGGKPGPPRRVAAALWEACAFALSQDRPEAFRALRDWLGELGEWGRESAARGDALAFAAAGVTSRARGRGWALLAERPETAAAGARAAARGLRELAGRLHDDNAGAAPISALVEGGEVLLGVVRSAQGPGEALALEAALALMPEALKRSARFADPLRREAFEGAIEGLAGREWALARAAGALEAADRAWGSGLRVACAEVDRGREGTLERWASMGAAAGPRAKAAAARALAEFGDPRSLRALLSKGERLGQGDLDEALAGAVAGLARALPEQGPGAGFGRGKAGERLAALREAGASMGADGALLAAARLWGLSPSAGEELLRESIAAGANPRGAKGDGLPLREALGARLANMGRALGSVNAKGLGTAALLALGIASGGDADWARWASAKRGKPEALERFADELLALREARALERELERAARLAAETSGGPSSGEGRRDGGEERRRGPRL